MRVACVMAEVVDWAQEGQKCGGCPRDLGGLRQGDSPSGLVSSIRGWVTGPGSEQLPEAGTDLRMGDDEQTRNAPHARREQLELLQSLQEQLRRRPDDASLLLPIAAILVDIGRSEEASSCLVQAHEATESPLPAALLARMASESGRERAAQQWFRASLERGLTKLAATGLASLLVGDGEYDAAIALYERVQRAGLADGETLGALAAALLRVGRVATARDLARRAVTMSPTSVVLWRLWSQCCRIDGSPRDGVRAAVAGLRRHGSRVPLLAELGLSLLDAGHVSWARKVERLTRDRAVPLDPAQ